jgi:hypothetical protein
MQWPTETKTLNVETTVLQRRNPLGVITDKRLLVNGCRAMQPLHEANIEVFGATMLGSGKHLGNPGVIHSASRCEEFLAISSANRAL